MASAEQIKEFKEKLSGMTDADIKEQIRYWIRWKQDIAETELVERRQQRENKKWVIGILVNVVGILFVIIGWCFFS